MMKFVAHSMSYIVFLILIALYTFSEQPAELYKLTGNANYSVIIIKRYVFSKGKS